ncbi:head-tail connector protein [Sphingomonas sanxanigenens]|uniref:Phage gp6-like head-tail connector protein n=1 Tax=Sphingomonas sanxanigenens DSM 19645 = NX02 TaxID=1123269 RepID=W0AEL7_9SPHN|nr:head-tail connector protein [Sphingomonas sanxanigenens]AHE55531.1 hypothetical protein NX02_19355 [Sphingomonas sanxanigenens DSM 19645 = NX02]
MPEPITLAEAKAHCRVLDDSEDSLFPGWIAAAREVVENFTGHILAPREVTQTFDDFGRVELRAWPIAADAVFVVSYTDPAGVDHVVGDARLISGVRPARLRPAFGAAWPMPLYSPGAVSVTVTAGYATPADVPQSLKQAMLLLIGHYFANRDAVITGTISGELPLGVEALCRPYRMVWIA